jgi:hypothetical protein
MNRTLLSSALVLLLLCVAVPSPATKQARADTSSSDCIYAVVRIPSHGGSATVVHTIQGKSYLLSCSHCFETTDQRPIQLDVPSKKRKAKPQARCRLIDIDYRSDLALLELDDGPLDFVAPVAPEYYRPGRHLLSVGYDEMHTPATVRPATITSTDDSRTFTVERPWHGRSGGPLLDADVGQVVGVVSGYETAPWGRGIYVSHQAIIRFLSRQHGAPEPKSQPRWSPFIPILGGP